MLFLDELPEFARAALEALREPLESGHITISRAARQAAFPARFQLVAAMNPCPCGYLGAFAATGKTCRCTPDGIARYRTRLSGPLLDRIDLQVEVHAVKPEALMAQADGEDSATVALRVAAARQRQMRRQAMPNAAIDAGRIDTLCTLDDGRCALCPGRGATAQLVEPRPAPCTEGGAHHCRPGRRRYHRHGPCGRGAAIAPLTLRRYDMKPR